MCTRPVIKITTLPRKIFFRFRSENDLISGQLMLRLAWLFDTKTLKSRTSHRIDTGEARRSLIDAHAISTCETMAINII